MQQSWLICLNGADVKPLPKVTQGGYCPSPATADTAKLDQLAAAELLKHLQQKVLLERQVLPAVDIVFAC